MKNKENNQPVVIEDVVWYRKEPNGDYCSIAKKTFYYTFLMEHADSKINGESNKQAAEDFKCYQDIFVFLMNKGILNNPEYCLDFCTIEGGATFTLNLDKVKSEMNIERLLRENFKESYMQKYIDSFLNPADGFKCDFCGAVSLSRHLSFGSGKNKITYCLACHPLKEELQKTIQDIYKNDGSLAAVKKRLALIEEACKPFIAPEKSINILLDEFKEENEVYNKSVPKIQNLLKEKHLDEFEVFGYDEFGLIIWNRKKLADINIFSECIILSEDGKDIIAVMDKAGVVYTDEKAVNFANKLKEEC